MTDNLVVEPPAARLSSMMMLTMLVGCEKECIQDGFLTCHAHDLHPHPVWLAWASNKPT